MVEDGTFFYTELNGFDINIKMSLIMRCDPAWASDASGQPPRHRQAQGNADQERERGPRETFYIGFMKQPVICCSQFVG